MRKFVTPLLLALIALMASGSTAFAELSNYAFFVDRGDQTRLSSPTTLWRGNQGSGGVRDDVQSINLPFTFRFNGLPYTSLSISTNGVIGLGSSDVTSSGDNDLTRANVPVIAPWWDALRVHGGAGCWDIAIRYEVQGTSPNRVLVINYDNIEPVQVRNAPMAIQFQVRLYETTNRIEFWYGQMIPCDYWCFGSGQCESTSGTIGLAANSDDYLSVNFWEGFPQASSREVDNEIDLLRTEFGEGTIFVFQPCNIEVRGDVAQGGTETMADNDILLSEMSVQRGGWGEYYPFTVFNPTEGCGDREYTFSITGPNAADYSLDITNGPIGIGESVTPMLTFTPSTIGVRNAFLTISDDNGFSRTYRLRATGTTRIRWTGNLAEGGTSTVANGDVLLLGKFVDRNTSQNFMPLTVTNFNDNPDASDAAVTYTIIDPTGQYSLVGGNTASLGAGESASPVIRFAPTGVGYQTASLIVNADGEIRVYELRAFSAAPGAVFTVGGRTAPAGTGVFVNQIQCVGEIANSQPMTVTNIGSEDLVISGINVYRTDTVYRQGTPGYPLLRDAFNRPIPMNDYFVTEFPGVAPPSANNRNIYPITVAAGETRTLYLTYVGLETGKRFGRLFLTTNAENFSGVDPNGETREGMLNFDLFGRGIGGRLTDVSGTGLPQSVLFPSMRVGDSVDRSYVIMNSGNCDLRISREFLKISAGDVRDFRMVSTFANAGNDGANYVLAPGQRDSIVVRFKPQRGGSRRATIRVQTNDSTIIIPGVSERGSYYLDLFGAGKTGLEYADLFINPAVVGGTPSIGIVGLENSSTQTIDIIDLTIVDNASNEFKPDAANPWPSVPTSILAGSRMKLGVEFAPVGGPGTRRARLRVVTSTNDTFYVNITAEAGVRTIAANPTSLFDGANVTVGTSMRQVLSITNTGTLPVTMQTPTISGSSDYTLGKLERLTLEPGAVEYLEVYFTPTAATSIPATLTINSDASSGPIAIALNGSGARTTKGSGDDPTTVLPGVETPALRFEHQSNGTTSGVGASEAIAGVSLSMAVPNPAREWVVLGYSLDRGRSIELGLYDERGRKLEVLASGMQPSGEHTVRVNVSALASGVYHYRLIVDGKAISKSFTVVR